MQDYTIGENFTLPSLGKVYSTEINPNIKLRSMTTEEELKRVASVDNPYKNMCEIMDDCMVEKPEISAYDMCVGDYQFLLHKLRVVTYGPEYPISNVCPYCGCTTDEVLNLDDLPVISYTEDFEKYREFDLPKSGNHIRLRVQTPRMLDEVTEAVKEYKKRTKGQGADPTLVYILMRLIETIDGGYPNPLKIEDWIRKLPMADTNLLIKYAEKMNDSIGISTKLECECDICGLTYESSLKTTAEFFRPALSI